MCLLGSRQVTGASSSVTHQNLEILRPRLRLPHPHRAQDKQLLSGSKGEACRSQVGVLKTPGRQHVGLPAASGGAGLGLDLTQNPGPGRWFEVPLLCGAEAVTENSEWRRLWEKPTEHDKRHPRA